MDYQIIWSLEALNDIEEISKYIERDSHFYAASVVTRILQKTSLLKTFPFSGCVVPEEMDENVREHFIFSYRSYMKSEKILCMFLPLYMGKECSIQNLKTGLRTDNESFHLTANRRR